MNKNEDQPKTPNLATWRAETNQVEMTRKNIVTIDPEVMDGKPCIRGMRITVGAILGHLSAGRTYEDILKHYPTLTHDDILAALEYAMWKCQGADIKP